MTVGDAAAVPANEWMEGVKRRAEATGDGYMRVPMSDWIGVVECFAWGEGLLAVARAEAGKLRAALEAPPTPSEHDAPCACNHYPYCACGRSARAAAVPAERET